MIKFFRQIRQRLVTENKVGRYLIYAIGEIFLVVIGILIALSLNTWNDNRKDRIAEKELYKTLIGSLENDLEDVLDKAEKIDTAIMSQEIFITSSYEEVVSRFSPAELWFLIGKVGNTSYSFFPNYSLYNKISNNKEIDLIQSKEIQMKIMELFEQHYKEYNDLDLNLEEKAQFSLVPNFFGKIAPEIIKNEGFDLEVFRENYAQLQIECGEIYFLSKTTRDSMRNCQRNIETLLDLLKAELSSLS
jgi:hypothetical protein